MNNNRFDFFLFNSSHSSVCPSPLQTRQWDKAIALDLGHVLQLVVGPPPPITHMLCEEVGILFYLSAALCGKWFTFRSNVDVGSGYSLISMECRLFHYKLLRSDFDENNNMKTVLFVQVVDSSSACHVSPGPSISPCRYTTHATAHPL